MTKYQLLPILLSSSWYNSVATQRDLRRKVLEFLKTHTGDHTIGEISDNLGTAFYSLRKPLDDLLAQGKVTRDFKNLSSIPLMPHFVSRWRYNRFERGWLKRELETAAREVRRWPKWMRQRVSAIH